MKWSALPLVFCLSLVTSTVSADSLLQRKTFSKAEASALVQKDLSAIETLQFTQTSKAFQRYFGTAGGRSLANYIRSKTKSIEFGILPIGSIARASDGKLTLDTEFVHASPVQRWFLLIHETRHNESRAWQHVMCPTPYRFTFGGSTYDLNELAGRLSGGYGCDASGDGAYAVTYTFLRAIAESCTNCSAEMRADAGRLAYTEGLIRILDPQAAKQLVEDASSAAGDVVSGAGEDESGASDAVQKAKHQLKAIEAAGTARARKNR